MTDKLKVHVLKVHPQPLADLISGAKTGEVRNDDRGFQVGDTVSLVEVNPDTGNWKGTPDHVRTISHIQRGYGLPDGLCVLSYAPAVEAAEIEVDRYWHVPGEGFRKLDPKYYEDEPGYIAYEDFERILAGVNQQAGSVVPEGWQARFTEAGDRWDAWQTCSKEHHDLVKRCPHEWPGYEVREIYAAPLPPSPAAKADA